MAFSMLAPRPEALPDIASSYDWTYSQGKTVTIMGKWSYMQRWQLERLSVFNREVIRSGGDIVYL